MNSRGQDLAIVLVVGLLAGAVATFAITNVSSPARIRTVTSVSTSAVSIVTTQSVTQTITETQAVTQTSEQGITTLVTVLSASSGETTCVDTGPSGILFLRVLNDSTMMPVAGANVTATNTPLFCSDGYPLDNDVTITFTTGNQEWYPLGGQGDDASFSVSVEYGGQNYSFVADIHAEANTCATLLVPSGLVNMTISPMLSAHPGCGQG